MLYAVVQWLHVVASIAALGANFTYYVWLARAVAEPAALPFTLGTVRVIEQRLANPSYAVAGITGLLLMWIGPYSFTTPWVASSVALFAAVGAVGGALYGPNLQRQIALAAQGGGESAEYRALHRRGNRLGTLLIVLVLAIVYLMVAQPLLWG